MSDQQSPGDLTGFPSISPSQGSTFYRAHKPSRGCWYFSTAGGRFDLGEPRGTCYWAESVEVAVREKLRGFISGGRFVTAKAAQSFVVTGRRIPSGLYADLTAVERARFGVLTDLVAGPEYSMSVRWANAFADEGFVGIRYGSRWGGGAGAWAVFGDAGEHPPADDAELEHHTGVNACRMTGLTILGRPRAEELDIVE